MPRKVEFVVTNELKLEGIVGFVKRKVTPHGTGAKVTCPKEYLGKTVYLVITDEPAQPQLNQESASSGGDGRDE